MTVAASEDGDDDDDDVPTEVVKEPPMSGELSMDMFAENWNDSQFWVRVFWGGAVCELDVD